MAKRKKKKAQPVELLKIVKPIETQYYWCVNCGHHGDYGSICKRSLICEGCKYDDITPYGTDEINDLDNITLDRFKRKGTEGEPNATGTKKLLKQLDNKYSPIKKEKTVAERLAEIQAMGD